MNADQTPTSPPLAPHERRELNSQFELGRRLFRAGRFSEAGEVFANCIERDPGNLLFVEAALQNVAAAHAKRGPSWLARWSQPWGKQFRLAAQADQWIQVLQLAPKALMSQGLQAELLGTAAIAAQHAVLPDVELRYWHAALQQDPQQVTTLSRAAMGFAAQGAFAEARECWNRVLRMDASNSTAAKALSILGRFAETGQGELAEAHLAAEQSKLGSLRQQAQLWRNERLFDAAESLMQKAIESAPGDWQIREEAEMLEVERKSVQLQIAKMLLTEYPDVALGGLVERLEEDLNRLEIDVYDRRSQRYPAEYHWRYELAERLSKAHMFFEAAAQFGQLAEAGKSLASGEPVCRQGEREILVAECRLREGESLQAVKQFERALKCYLEAAQSPPPNPPVREESQQFRERAQRRLATLAEAMGRTAQTRQALEWLLERFPEESELRARLDKLPAIEDKG